MYEVLFIGTMSFNLICQDYLSLDWLPEFWLKFVIICVLSGYVTLDNGQRIEEILQDTGRIQYIKDIMDYTLQAIR